MKVADEAEQLLGLFGIHSSGRIVSHSPIDGSVIGRVTVGDPDLACARAEAAFLRWRSVPAPRRGELIRVLANLLREAKPVLAKLITLECGKILQESLGEVQEMIDICDFAVGLSRQLYGLTIASERPDHRMMEQWHPLGPVLVISAFNFPVAVWAWNAALAVVCGNPVIWKPSEKTPLCAEAVMVIVRRAIDRVSDVPEGSSSSSRESAMSVRRWSTIRASRWFPRPDRPRWAVRSGREWRSALGGSFWSLAATMRASSRRARTSSLPRAPSSSLLPGQPASAALRSGDCSFRSAWRSRSSTEFARFSARFRSATRGSHTLVGPLIDESGLRCDEAGGG